MTPAEPPLPHAPGIPPTGHLEEVLAVGRAFLTVAALAAIYIDPAEPARLREVTYAVLAGYAAYSVIVWMLLRRARRLHRVHTLVLHGVDILWTSALTFVSQGPISPFFLFFLFAVLAAAYRWGFRETLVTALVTIAVLLVEAAVAVAGPWKNTVFASFAFDGTNAILRVAYLLMTGVLLGYLAEQDKRTRRELATAAAVARQPHLRLGLGGSVASLGQTLRDAFQAAAVVIVVKDEHSRRAVRWRVEAGAGRARHRVRREELPGGDDGWLSPAPAGAWCARRRDPAASSAEVLAVTAGAWRLQPVSMALPPAVVSEPGWTSVMAADFGIEREWRARACVFDGAGGAVERQVHFLRTLADHVTPALTNVFLLRRLRTRAGAAERARVARELHDGAIQALFAIDMELEAIRRETSADHGLARRVTEIQKLVRREVVDLRALMQALRPVEIETSDQLPDVLAHLVDRFSRDSGIGARFVATDTRVPLSAPQAQELVKMAQEALVNVRKHSGAGQVLVRLTASDADCQLVVEDDGRGFGFDGRLTLQELDDRRAGPAVIKERARLIGASLTIESAPGAGARLEIAVSGDAHA